MPGAPPEGRGALECAPPPVSPRLCHRSRCWLPRVSVGRLWFWRFLEAYVPGLMLSRSTLVCGLVWCGLWRGLTGFLKHATCRCSLDAWIYFNKELSIGVCLVFFA